MKTSLRLFTEHSFCAAVLTASVAWGQTPGPLRADPPRPGSINYVEGQASIGTIPVTPSAIGSLVLEKDQTLSNQTGKMEVLLTPGVFLRVAENSSVKMVSLNLATTRIELTKGRALIEMIQIRKENDIWIDQNGASTKLLKNGLYGFDADHAQVRVFKGNAELDTANQKITLTERREIVLNNGGKLKTQGFDSRAFEDEFYRWNGLRSGYLSEASVSTGMASRLREEVAAELSIQDRARPEGDVTTIGELCTLLEIRNV